MMRHDERPPVSPRLCRGVDVRGGFDLDGVIIARHFDSVICVRVARSTPRPRNCRGLRERTQGFTLIEIVVVIGIIALLASLTVAVSSTLIRKAEMRQGEDTLQLLSMALQEWETAADRQLTYGTDNQPNPGDRYDLAEDIIAGDANDIELTRKLLFRLLKNASANAVLSKIDTDYLRRHPDNALAAELQQMLVDPWDKEYLVVFPGPLDPAVLNVDDDGTLRTEFEKRYGICINRKIAFVSAGPDGDFGDLQLNNPPSTPANSAADDNMYSSPLKTRLP